jgi:hypothetical protein
MSLKDELSALMAIIWDEKVNMTEGVYLKLCNAVQRIYESNHQPPFSAIIPYDPSPEIDRDYLRNIFMNGRHRNIILSSLNELPGPRPMPMLGLGPGTQYDRDD